MNNFGSTYPIVRDSEAVLAGECPNKSVALAAKAPVFTLTVNNPEVPELWEDEPAIGGLIQEENLEAIILD